MTQVLLQMGWPAAVVLIALIIGTVVIYSVRTATQAETKRIERQSVPSREIIEHRDHD